MSSASRGPGSTSSPVSSNTKTPHADYTDLHHAHGNHANMLPENSNSLLNSCIGRVLGPHNHALWSNSTDAVQNLFVALGMLKSPSEDMDGTITQVFTEIGVSSAVIAESCVHTPKEFWKVSDVFIQALSTAPVASESFSTIIESFEAIGKWCVRKDPQSSVALFCDFALLKVPTTVLQNPGKRTGVLRAMYAFSPPGTTSHVQCIKRLQAALPNIFDFISCLSVLAPFETNVDAALLDLYMYYVAIGLAHPNPKLRACSVFIMASLLPMSSSQATDVINLLPEIRRLSEEEVWWETRVYLLQLAGGLLHTYSVRGPASEIEDTAICEASLAVIKQLFTPKASRTIKLMGMVRLCNVVGFSDELAQILLNVLCSLSKVDRALLLSPPGQGSYILPSSNGTPFAVVPITGKWSAVTFAQAIVNRVKTGSLDRMEASLMHVFSATVDAACRGQRGFPTVLTDSWIDVFTNIKEYIYVGLCDPECAQHATYVLSNYLMYSSLRGETFLDQRLIGALRLLYPSDGSGNKFCQSIVENMFRVAFGADTSFEAAVLNTLELFQKNFSAQYSASSLQRLAKEFN